MHNPKGYPTMTSVLDHGYVRLVDYMGDDLRAVNAARASFMKESKELSDKDISLLGFLSSSKPPHLSPFRHSVLQFEISAPLIVARQIWRYITGAANEGGHDELLAWNEASFRYVSQELKFYIPQPNEWRGAPDNKKQGSKGHVSTEVGEIATASMTALVDMTLATFEELLDAGIATEQARLVLPSNALYTTWYYTTSLQGFSHMLLERLDNHAMYETRLYAQAMEDLAWPFFPLSLGALAETEA